MLLEPELSATEVDAVKLSGGLSSLEGVLPLSVELIGLDEALVPVGGDHPHVLWLGASV